MTCNVELRSQETKLELLTILKARLRAYTVSLPTYAVLSRNRLIDDSAHRFELLISRYLSHHTLQAPFSLARRYIDSFTFVATNMFFV